MDDNATISATAIVTTNDLIIRLQAIMYTMFFIVLISTVAAVLVAHRFVMNSVESFDGYGAGTFREWQQFEREKLNF